MRAMLTDAASNDLPRSLAAYPGPVLILAAPDESIPGPLEPGNALGDAPNPSSLHLALIR